MWPALCFRHSFITLFMHRVPGREPDEAQDTARPPNVKLFKNGVASKPRGVTGRFIGGLQLVGQALLADT